MKYFVISDIHSFYDEMIRDLTKAGYDKENHNHVLIVCGDIFDRGEKSLEVYNFLRSISKERRILIRGNHEILLRQLCERKYAETHDVHNGTLETVYQLNNWDDKKEEHDYYKKLLEIRDVYNKNIFEQKYSLWNRRKQLYSSDIMKEVLDWIASDEWVNYYETKDYIFVHAFIPVQEHIDFEKSMICGYFVKTAEDTYREDWRNATQQEWEDAMWPCPWKQVKLGLNKTDKTIVCGHWHTSDFYNNLSNKNSKKKYTINENPIYKSKRYKLIGLDACTAVTHKINVFTFEE